MHLISKIIFILETYKFLACPECISRNGLTFGHLDWDPSCVNGTTFIVNSDLNSCTHAISRIKFYTQPSKINVSLDLQTVENWFFFQKKTLCMYRKFYFVNFSSTYLWLGMTLCQRKICLKNTIQLQQKKQWLYLHNQIGKLWLWF